MRGLSVVVLLVVAVALYFLPTVIGALRRVVNIGSVFAVNLLLGWSLIGWVVALAMALRTNPPHAYPGWMPPAGPRAPPPGWYVDPAGTGNLRWWDGTTWTDHRQP